MRKTWRPKFKVGDHLLFASHVSSKVLGGTGFLRDDNLIVVDRSVRERSRDPRANRYFVEAAGERDARGWFYEDDLEAF